MTIEIHVKDLSERVKKDGSLKEDVQDSIETAIHLSQYVSSVYTITVDKERSSICVKVREMSREEFKQLP